MTSSAIDVFKHARLAGDHLITEIGDETISMLLTYQGVRTAAKNWQTYSSDAPFRVPIPSEENQRSVRQLPIETDPPEHRAYRALLEPIFRRPMQADYIAAMDGLVRSTLLACLDQPALDIVRGLALPLQSRALALLLGVPQSEAETWISWGTHVFHDGDDPEQKGADLEAYLMGAIEAGRGGEDPENFFTALHRLQIDGRTLTDAERLGTANLVFAGGRDTVINTVAFLLDHFAHHPAALKMTASSSLAINLAVEESIRVVSPLTHIGRVCTHADPGHSRAAGERISLCWAAANYDPEVFDQSEQVDLSRAPNPHVGFGSGHHACLGAAQARALLRSLIRNLADLVSEVSIVETVPAFETLGALEREVGFEKLIVDFKGKS
jgi:cytochrome P450